MTLIKPLAKEERDNSLKALALDGGLHEQDNISAIDREFGCQTKSVVRSSQEVAFEEAKRE